MHSFMKTISRMGWQIPFIVLFSGNAVFAAEIDQRSASVICAMDKDGRQVECDYRHEATLKVKDVSLKVADKAIQISAKGISNYPAIGQSTALLFLVDVSDPRRKNTVQHKNVSAITKMLTSLKPHHKVGVAVFDSDIRIISNIGTDVAATQKAVAGIKAGGQATEFYKNIIAAIELLQKTDAARKGLIIMSDGKDEDKAYRHEDALKAAKDAGVVILGMGYLEKPADSPYLQTLKRLADETHGLYFNATDEGRIADLLQQPAAFVEKGGRVTFDPDLFIGRQEITVILGTKDNQRTELKTFVNLPDNRTKLQCALDFAKKFWPYISGATVGFIAMLIWLRRLWKRRKLRISKFGGGNACLEELNSSGTRHKLTKTAVRIGRNSDNDVCLANDSISSHHAEINRRREGGFYIVDLSSRNGTYVNDIKVTQTELHDNDLVEIGEVRLRFSIK